jgi:four helix bundle protein
MNIALGSACELDYLIMLATELGYIETKTAEDLAVAVMEVRRMLGGFIKKLKA